MADLTVAAYRNGRVNFKESFDVGAGPSVGLEQMLNDLRMQHEDGDVELDADALERASWLCDWENLAYLDGRDGWKREGGAESAVTTTICDRAELTRIMAAMDALRPTIATVHANHLAKWDELARFLRRCAEKNGTICLYCDPEG